MKIEKRNVSRSKYVIDAVVIGQMEEWLRDVSEFMKFDMDGRLFDIEDIPSPLVDLINEIFEVTDTEEKIMINARFLVSAYNGTEAIERLSRSLQGAFLERNGSLYDALVQEEPLTVVR